MSNNGQLRVIPSVFTVILKDGKVLMLRRANTGWMDGYYDLPAGHLEDQEHLKDGAARELMEEAGLSVKTEDLKLVHIYQNHHQSEAPHYGFIFLAKAWSGTPKLMEVDKSDDMDFFPLDKLPPKTTPYVRNALKKLDSKEVTISYQPPGSIKMD
jgi:8-oxo-dGTP diphosphatase